MAVQFFGQILASYPTFASFELSSLGEREHFPISFGKTSKNLNIDHLLIPIALTLGRWTWFSDWPGPMNVFGANHVTEEWAKGVC